MTDPKVPLVPLILAAPASATQTDPPPAAEAALPKEDSMPNLYPRNGERAHYGGAKKRARMLARGRH
jgi:hypothetical protein